jgi:hypothetical protein
MNSILAVEKGLPPGLWLPTAEESTEQYLRENFDHTEHSYEEIIDYGAFVVAMSVMGADQRERKSFMPQKFELRDMHRAGYGISERRIMRDYGGLKKLQGALGFYPRGYVPTREELLERLRWMASYSFDPETDLDGPATSVNKIIAWGANRNLLPSQKVIYDVLEGDTTEAQHIFGTERPFILKNYDMTQVYKLGAMVIRENGGPIRLLEDMNVQYRYLFPKNTPHRVIEEFFGSSNKFWQEFGYIPDARRMSSQDLIGAGVRIAIESRDPVFTKKRIEELSKQKRFASKEPIHSRCGGVINYRERVMEVYDEFLRMRDDAIEAGVSEETVVVVCRNFEATPEFETWLTENRNIFVKLSNSLPSGQYARSIIKNGLNLEDDVIRHMQLTDLKNALRTIGIVSKKDLQVILGLIPRIDPEKAPNLLDNLDPDKSEPDSD